jgi:hypothetical protein
MAIRSTRSRLITVAIRFSCALFIFIAALILPPERPLFAQQVQVLPSQQKPPVQNLPRLPAPSQEETIPSMPSLPAIPGGQGSNMREIPLPEIFRGCWSGEVAQVDSMIPLTQNALHVQWLSKLYTLCYKQVGAGDRWHLTFAENSVAQRSMVSDQRQSISVKSVAGRDRAELTGYLHFRAPEVNLFGFRSSAVNTLDELSQLHCTVSPDRTAMYVRAEVLVENDDEPWVKITWHTRLLRTGAGLPD